MLVMWENYERIGIAPKTVKNLPASIRWSNSCCT
jgi:hypothetical protein